MSEYKVERKSSIKFAILRPDGSEAFDVGDNYFARVYCDLLNKETAPLLAIIQAQQANLQIAADMLAEERAKVAHRNELLRIQGEACERYKAAIEDARQALSNQTHGGAQYQPDVLEADSILANALEETTANDGTPVIHLPPKASEGAPPPRITYSIDTESEGE